MDPEKKRIWIEALRSGKYKQGQTWLKNTREENRLCCLGVYADAVEHVEWVDGHYHSRFEYNGLTFDTNVSHEMISAEQQSHLIKMNDVFLNSFSEIADWI